MPPSTDNSDAGSPEVTRTGRLLSLDAFRGMTILAMVLVNNPGSWGAMYWPLKHAEWHGWTPTDLIFPFFLFIVGTSLAYSLRRYRDGITSAGEESAALRRPLRGVYWRILRRTGLLVFLGWFPGLLFRVIGHFGGDEGALDLSTLRLPGVLVRIGIVYFCASMIVLNLRLRGQIVLATVVLLGYWGLLAWLPSGSDYTANLSPGENVVGAVDRYVLGESHMYTYDRATKQLREPTDPEGLLSTLPAVVTALIGYWTGLFIQRRGVNYAMVGTLAAAGLVCTALGQGWHEWLPINKKIWTSSFVLLSGGLAMVVLAGCLLKFDLWGWRRLARPFEMVGVNAILVFVGSGILATALNRCDIGGVSAHDRILDGIGSVIGSAPLVSLGWDWMAAPEFASLCYALLNVGFWWLVCWLMWRLGWQLRV